MTGSTFLLTALGFCQSANAADPHLDHAMPSSMGEVVDGKAGYLVVAADRGFLGNKEIRDAVHTFTQSETRDAEVVFVLGESSEARLALALDTLRGRGADQVVALPLFLSAHHPRLARTQAWLSDEDVVWARPFGDTYLAVEVLAERLRTVERPHKHNAILLSYGAETEGEREQMQADLDRLGEQAAAELGMRRIQSIVWFDMDAEPQDNLRRKATGDLIRAILRPGRSAVVPYNLGPKLDSMMSLGAFARARLPRRTHYVEEEVLPHPAVALWMEREASRLAPLSAQDLGVVFLAHGADFDWNEAMRDAVAPLHERYDIAFAFSMADQPVIARAVEQLEDRGARAIVVVRVFGLASSFEHSVHRMFGLDIEQHHSGHTADHGSMGHGTMMPPSARIHTASRVTTVGGLEDSPLFAQGLLARAQSLSTDPANETLILTAHGAGEDERNDQWRTRLTSLADQMVAEGAAFRAIETGTWREDWPKQRKPEIAAIRAAVEAGNADGGRVIVIPARTAGQGPEDEYLAGLDYTLGTEFAPSKPFLTRVEAQIRQEALQLGVDLDAQVTVDAVGPDPGLNRMMHDQAMGHEHHHH